MKVAAPHADTCPLCDKPLGTAPLLKRRRLGWVHKLCWIREHQ